MQFLLTAYDGTDEHALERRLSARENHFAAIEQLKSLGRVLYAAAILDEQEKMIGSVIVYDFSSREELETFLKEEPYITGGVWEQIDIRQCRVPPLFLG